MAPRAPPKENTTSSPGMLPVRTLLIADTGCEAACAREVALLLPNAAPPEVKPCVVTIHCTLAEASLLGYRVQCARRVLVALTPTLPSLGVLETTTPDATVVAACCDATMTFKADGGVLAFTSVQDARRAERNPDTVETHDDTSDEESHDDAAPDAAADGATTDDETDVETTGDDAHEMIAEEDDDLRATRPLTLPPTQELVEGIGGWFHAHGHPVNLKAPDLIVYGVLTRDGHDIGIDVVGRSLSRREYRIMLSRRSLKATVAAAAVIYADAVQDELLLDPIAEDGSLVIEAALLRSRTSPQRFAKTFAFQRFPAFVGTDWNAWRAAQDGTQVSCEHGISAFATSLQEVKAMRMNAKLASIEKQLHATKVAVDWIDLKLEERSMDRIITQPIVGGKSLAPRQAEKIIDHLFDQAAYVLKRKHTITCITEKPKELTVAAATHGFVLASTHDVLMGRRPMTIVTWRLDLAKRP